MFYIFEQFDGGECVFFLMLWHIVGRQFHSARAKKTVSVFDNIIEGATAKQRKGTVYIRLPL